jgi:pyruvate dehydrogenase E2 component (dihydrolipoamide acetyltransferase)
VAKVTMPQLGESVAEGTIGKWLKQPGDTVAKYEPLLEVITDKVNAEVPSPYAGVLREILAEEGATVPNNAEIAVIETADEGATAGDSTAPAPESVRQIPAAEARPNPGGVAPMALEKEASAAEEDSGGPHVELRDADAATPAGVGEGSASSGSTAATTSASTTGDGASTGGASTPEGATVPAAPASEPAGTGAGTSTGPGTATGTGTGTGAQSGGATGRAAATAAPAPTATDSGGDEPRMTPAVRRLLREHGLTASQIAGTGMGGRLTRDDVMAYVQQHGTSAAAGGATNGSSVATPPTPTPAPAAPAATPAAGADTSAAAANQAPTKPTEWVPATNTPFKTPAPAAGSASAPAASAPAASAPAASGGRGIAGQQVTFPDGADEVLVPMTQMRKGIAAQMTRALQVPHAYVQMEVDATRLVKLRDSAKRDYQAREGISLSFVPFVVKAIVNALKRNPAFNAHWTEQGVLAKRRINMGVAVAVPDGLMVPVVKDVDQLSIAGINRAITEVAARARASKLRLDDIQGGTFTIDNTGWFGSNMTMPIINVPEVAILTMENITKRPVVVETPEGDVIAIRPIMNMVIGIDHRANDGAQAAAFLNDVKQWLESVPADLPIW